MYSKWKNDKKLKKEHKEIDQIKSNTIISQNELQELALKNTRHHKAKFKFEQLEAQLETGDKVNVPVLVSKQKQDFSGPCGLGEKLTICAYSVFIILIIISTTGLAISLAMLLTNVFGINAQTNSTEKIIGVSISALILLVSVILLISFCSSHCWITRCCKDKEKRNKRIIPKMSQIHPSDGQPLEPTTNYNNPSYYNYYNNPYNNTIY